MYRYNPFYYSVVCTKIYVGKIDVSREEDGGEVVHHLLKYTNMNVTAA